MSGNCFICCFIVIFFPLQTFLSPSTTTRVAVLILGNMKQAHTRTMDEIYNQGCIYNNTSSDLNANVVIGALFPIQDLDLGSRRYIYTLDGMPWVESFLYTIESINNNSGLLPGMRLGFDVRNSCNDINVAIKHTVDFIMDNKFFSTKTSSQTWTNKSCKCKSKSKNVLAAIVGGKSNAISLTMSKILSADYIPQVSYASSSPNLSKKNISKSFLRTVPSDLHQTYAIVDLLQKMNWTFPFAIAADDDFGRQVMLNLRESMKKYDMCMAMEKLFDSNHPEYNIPEIISAIKKDRDKTSVVILWSEYEQAKQLIDAAHNAGLSKLTWIGPETWAANIAILKARIFGQTELDIINKTNGIISIVRTTPLVNEFEEFFDRIVFKSHLQNVWFESFWNSLGLTKENNPSGQIVQAINNYNVISSVYAIAYGLHSFYNCTKDMCRNKDRIMDYEELWKAIRKSSFIVPGTNQRLEFDNNGDVSLVSYNYAAWPDINHGKKLYTFGRWSAQNNKSFVNKSMLKRLSFGGIPKALCSTPCTPGHQTTYGQRKCCWECSICQFNEISLKGIKCVHCPKMTISNKEHTACETLTNINISIHTNQGKILVAFSMLGVVAVLVVMLFFFKYWDTPIIKASSREMSIIQLLAMMLIFCLPNFYLIKLTPPICAAQIVWFGILYAYIISFIFIKTYRLMRVFKKKRFTKVSRFLQNRYQMLLSILLVFIQLVGVIVWFLVNPPNVKYLVDREEITYVYFCGEKEDILLYYNIGYVFFLSLISGWMAFRARQLPENFNEAQYISFAMFTTCLAWILFALLYASSDRTEKPVVFLSINLINNFCLLVILYGNKINIILIYPHLNSKSHFLKMTTNATVTTFINDSGNNGANRSREQSVITFDFDAMFESYRRKKEQSVTLPTRRNAGSTVRQKASAYFPSTTKLLSRFNSPKSTVKNRSKTMRKTNMIVNSYPNRSVSLDDMEVYKIQRNNIAYTPRKKHLESLEEIAEISPRKKSSTISEFSYQRNNSQAFLVRNDSERKSDGGKTLVDNRLSTISIESIMAEKNETFL